MHPSSRDSVDDNSPAALVFPPSCVYWCCRALAEDLPAEECPAGWWDVEADVGLLVGLYRHGLNAYEEVRRDPDLVAAFQVGLGRICRLGSNLLLLAATALPSNPQQGAVSTHSLLLCQHCLWLLL